MSEEGVRCPSCGDAVVTVHGQHLTGLGLKITWFLGVRLVPQKEGGYLSCTACGHAFIPAPVENAQPEPEVDEDALDARWQARFGEQPP